MAQQDGSNGDDSRRPASPEVARFIAAMQAERRHQLILLTIVAGVSLLVGTALSVGIAAAVAA